MVEPWMAFDDFLDKWVANLNLHPNIRLFFSKDLESEMIVVDGK